MNGNTAANLLLMTGAALLAGSVVAIVCLVVGFDAITSLLTGAIAMVWGAVITGIYCQW